MDGGGFAIGMSCGFGAGMGSGIAAGMASGRKKAREELCDRFRRENLKIVDSRGETVPFETVFDVPVGTGGSGTAPRVLVAAILIGILALTALVLFFLLAW